MISEAIILAGGLGTRLRSVVPDLPKCMALVAGKPFLAHVINYIREQGITRFIFSLGYKSEYILDYLTKEFSQLNYSCSIEEEPLGTGGAVLNALSLASTTDVLVLNGDTLFSVDLQQLSTYHEIKRADCTLALKPMRNSERYGVVETDKEGRITSFMEKKWYAESHINGGVYALDTRHFRDMPFPVKFSFEKDYLEKYYKEIKMYGLVQDAYFIDIGIPEDLERAQHELNKE